MDVEPDRPPIAAMTREEAAAVLLELAHLDPVSTNTQTKNEMGSNGRPPPEDEHVSAPGQEELKRFPENPENTKGSTFTEQASLLFSQSPSRFRQRRLPPPVINTAPGFYVPNYIESGNPMENDRKLRKNSPPERVLVGYGRPLPPSDSAPLPGEAAFLEEASSSSAVIPVTKPHSAPFFTPESWTLIPNDVVTPRGPNLTSTLMEHLKGNYPTTPTNAGFNSHFSQLDEQSRTITPRVLQHQRSELATRSRLGYEGITATKEMITATTPSFAPFSPTAAASREWSLPHQSIWATGAADFVARPEYTPVRHSSQNDSSMSGPTEIEESPEQPLRGGGRDAAIFARMYQDCKVDLELLAEQKSSNSKDAINHSVIPADGQDEVALTVADRVQDIEVNDISFNTITPALGNLQGGMRAAADPFVHSPEGRSTELTNVRDGSGPMIFGSMSAANSDTLGLDLGLPNLPQPPRLPQGQFVYETSQYSQQGDPSDYATNSHALSSRLQGTTVLTRGIYQPPTNPIFMLNTAPAPVAQETVNLHGEVSASAMVSHGEHLGRVRAGEECYPGIFGSRASSFQSSPTRTHLHSLRDSSIDLPNASYSTQSAIVPESFTFRHSQANVRPAAPPSQVRFAVDAGIRGGFYRRGRRPGATNVPGGGTLTGSDEDGGISLGTEAPAPVVWTERWHPDSLRNMGVWSSSRTIKAQLPEGLNPEFYRFEAGGCFFCIKSKSEDDIRASVIHGIWSSTEKGNQRLDEQYKNPERTGPFLLIFAVNGSHEICGIAEMISPVDFEDKPTIWLEPIYKGSFKVRWIFLKNVDYCNFSHILIDTLPGSMPATYLRDALPYRFAAGKEIMKLYVHAPLLRNLFTHPKPPRSNWRARALYSPRASTRGRGSFFSSARGR